MEWNGMEWNPYDNILPPLYNRIDKTIYLIHSFIRNGRKTQIRIFSILQNMRRHRHRRRTRNLASISRNDYEVIDRRNTCDRDIFRVRDE
jgi:hypothetical protein